MLLIQHLYTFFNKFLLNFENLQKDVYKQSVREYTYTVIKKNSKEVEEHDRYQ